MTLTESNSCGLCGSTQVTILREYRIPAWRRPSDRKKLHRPSDRHVAACYCGDCSQVATVNQSTDPRELRS